MTKEEIKSKFILTDEQRKALQNEYYNTSKKTNIIIEEFNLKGLRPAELTYLFDDIITEIPCEHCGEILRQHPPTRTTVNKVKFCPNCGHKIYSSNYETCHCERCEKQYIKLIEDTICKHRNYPKMQYEELFLDEIITLGAIYRYGTDSNKCLYWNGNGEDLHLQMEVEEREELI